MKKTFLTLSFLAALSGFADAAEWRNWRGPFYNGTSDEKNLPDDFSKTSGVLWSVDLPGAGAATPIICNDRVFISSTNKARESLEAICYDAKTGKELWRHEVAKGIRKDTRSTYSAPSPTTDGEVVVFFYGNGEMVGYDFAGKQLWKKNIGPFGFGWTFSTSPVIYEGTMYMQILQGGKNPSVILGMDPKTGKELFRAVRPSKAQAESLESFNTPMPYEHNGRKELLVAGGDDLTGHDLKTGKELWRWGTWNPTRIGHWRLVPSPIAGGGIILVCAPKRDPVYAIKAGGMGLLEKDAIAWISTEVREISSDVPTPAFYDGDFFVLSDVRRALLRIEPATGKVKWKIETPGRSKYEASPLAADGKIYLINFDGEVTIVAAGDGKVLKTIPMEGPMPGGDVRSSISVANGRLYIRVTNKLYCVGK
jgi:outer membrane protein assembly factor BamB